MRNIRHKRAFAKGALAGALAVFLAVAAFAAAGKISIHTGAIDAKTAKKAQDIEKLIDKSYLYPEDADKKKQRDMALKGYTAALGDPYSVYYTEEETKRFFEATDGEYAGIGALMTQDAETGEIRVEEVYEDSPADKGGMLEGDIFYAVDGEKVDKKSLSDIVKKVKGEKGTRVKITVWREGSKKELEITRDIVETKTVETEMKENHIGYLKISEFDKVTYRQFKNGLEKLEKEGIKGLVVDLRGNPGGNLDTVCEILDLILPEGIIVYTEDRDGKRIETKKSDEKHQFTKPLAVVVDGDSASASEIFAGAIQDYGIGTIVGTTTFGKGIVQSVYPIIGGASLKITTAQYFTPKGRSIHKKGIKPDIEAEYEPGAKEDKQLEKALETVKEQIG